MIFEFSTGNAVFFAAACALKIWEFFFPMRALPRSSAWLLRSCALAVFQLAILYAFTWLTVVSRPVGLVDFSAQSLARQNAVALVLISFVSYWQHRLKHRFEFLWRFFHQVHHSPARVELLTSLYRNPLEILLNAICLYAIMFRILSFDTSVVMNVVLFLGLADLFYHANIRTPYILGFFIQRPESHLIHHMRSVQAYNYADLPVWDMLFGTFRNLKRPPRTFGFAHEQESDIMRLICGGAADKKRVVRHGRIL